MIRPSHSSTVKSLFTLTTSLILLGVTCATEARQGYWDSAKQQKLPGITGCVSCHQTASNRWPGIDNAFYSGGLRAVSQCLGTGSCGQVISGGSGSSDSAAPVLKTKLLPDSVGSPNSNQAAINVYKMVCPGKTEKLAVSLNAQSINTDDIVTIQALKNFSASIGSDPTLNDDAYGPVAELERGGGVYTILVSKLASATAGADNFTAKLECLGKPKAIHFDDDEDDD